jgi:hypothetical protein
MNRTPDHPTDWKYKGRLDETVSDMVWRNLNLELFGITERSNTYRLPLKKDDQIGSMEAGALVMLPVGDETRESYLIPRDMTESKFDKFVKPLREAEIKAYEKAIDFTLEKTLANVAVLLSICLATALALWTSVQTFNATNA